MRTECPGWMVLSSFICCGPSISQRGTWRAAAGVLESEMSVDVGSQAVGWGSRIRAGSHDEQGLSCPPCVFPPYIGSTKTHKGECLPKGETNQMFTSLLSWRRYECFLAIVSLYKSDENVK